MTLPQALSDFFQAQKERYQELFWYQLQVDSPTPRLILMTEKLAQQAREILTQEKREELAVVSFEQDDSLGDFYLVEAEVVSLSTRPSKQEYQKVTDERLEVDFIDQKNDLVQGQWLRVFQPQGYHSFCAVVYHSFDGLAPRGPIGWLASLSGLRKLGSSELKTLTLARKEKLISLTQACQELEGVNYSLGGSSRKNGFDCSGLVQQILFRTQGFWLPRKASWQAKVCQPVSLTELQPGDLVFFHRLDDPNKEIDHVALVYQLQPGRLPIVFHAKRLLGKAVFQDLNSANWLYSETNPDGAWQITLFGRPLPPISKKLIS